MRQALLTLFIISIFNCCNNDVGEYKYTTAFVDSTKHIHWGKGYYKLRVFYSFLINETKVHGVYDHKLEMAYTSKYEKGDSTLIRYNINNINESKLIKATFKMRKRQ